MPTQVDEGGREAWISQHNGCIENGRAVCAVSESSQEHRYRAWVMPLSERLNRFGANIDIVVTSAGKKGLTDFCTINIMHGEGEGCPITHHVFWVVGEFQQRCRCTRVFGIEQPLGDTVAHPSIRMIFQRYQGRDGTRIIPMTKGTADGFKRAGVVVPARQSLDQCYHRFILKGMIVILPLSHLSQHPGRDFTLIHIV